VRRGVWSSSRAQLLFICMKQRARFQTQSHQNTGNFLLEIKQTVSKHPRATVCTIYYRKGNISLQDVPISTRAKAPLLSTSIEHKTLNIIARNKLFLHTRCFKLLMYWEADNKVLSGARSRVEPSRPAQWCFLSYFFTQHFLYSSYLYPSLHRCSQCPYLQYASAYWPHVTLHSFLHLPQFFTSV